MAQAIQGLKCMVSCRFAAFHQILSLEWKYGDLAVFHSSLLLILSLLGFAGGQEGNQLLDLSNRLWSTIVYIEKSTVTYAQESAGDSRIGLLKQSLCSLQMSYSNYETQ